MAELPAFTYHPDPVATGMVHASDTVCRACGRARGFIYAGPVYAIRELDDAICPWCIADGSAAAKFDAEFTEATARAPDELPPEVIDTIARRTVGFEAWQEPQWLYHCNDGAAFLGLVGAPELAELPDAIEALRHECEEYGFTPDQTEEHLAALDRDGDPTAYLFRCRHCGVHLAYSDYS